MYWYEEGHGAIILLRDVTVYTELAEELEQVLVRELGLVCFLIVARAVHGVGHVVAHARLHVGGSLVYPVADEVGVGALRLEGWFHRSRMRN